ncbi:XdhC family protein [Litoreibacter janthinus]|uniref:Xanthine dehydrogenase accessory factor n=1 Tax=Litoreibacter janthinus TaxID=670154 RepID=A0A1I6GZI9_9RHOB|nr:XdhC family protein [Litoreibacter janthinus]SFR47600.1 xanthine dehydrogenase accessory factor [Litoreibacter janthinus]
MTTDLNDIPAIALKWHRAGTGAALATVVETWGSAPRPVGSQLAISGHGDIMGSVSGGCVEGAVVVEAMDALDDGKPRLLEYGVSDDEAFAVGLACGGTIRVLVEPVGAAISEDLLAQLVEARAASTPIAYTVDTESWVRELVGPDSFPERFKSDKSGFEGSLFVAIHNPPLRMAVIGGVHIAQSLLPMARAAGFAPVLIDPREAFASAERFPETTLLHDWPDAALDAVGIDARTAIVTLTHDPKLDDPAIQAALRSSCFYLGCLGSTRTHAKRVARLVEAGFDEAQIARIHAPVGLNIGAKSPAEIAVSIMAQIIQTLRQG